MTIRKSFDATLHVQVTPEMKEAVQRIASDEMTTTSELLRRLLHRYFSEEYPLLYPKYMQEARIEDVLEGDINAK